ncbi:MAG: hypothetical protein Ct9H300mP1_23080 [Planctomycetaceae bacterium]|nr:MAG: hypothetical protein Ct9H300mP1_23080 [Planctomycetaceae bacterium]
MRFGPDHVTPSPETAFDFSDFGGIARAAEQCSGVGACRKSLVGTMCPSYMATRNEADSTRGRANALRMAINGQLGPEGLSHPSLKPALDLCLECKACKSECPTGVDMARMKSEYLYQFHRNTPRPRHDHRFANIRRTLELASKWPPLFNLASQTRLGRWLAGIAPERQPPQVAHRSLLTECQSLTLADPLTADVTFFPDTFSLHCEPHHVLAAIRVAQSQGLSAGIAPPVCCGRPLISRGFLDEARLQAESLVKALSPLAQAHRPIVFLEPGCWSAVIDDLPHLVSLVGPGISHRGGPLLPNLRTMGGRRSSGTLRANHKRRDRAAPWPLPPKSPDRYRTGRRSHSARWRMQHRPRQWLLRNGRLIWVRTRPPRGVPGNRRAGAGPRSPRPPWTCRRPRVQLPPPGRAPDRGAGIIDGRMAGRPTR